jgi:hypothetical protein
MSSRDLFAEWAGIADRYLAEAGFGDEPTDPWLLATCQRQLVVHGARSCACRLPGVLVIDMTIEDYRQNFDLCHELAHDAMARMGYANVHDEMAASWIGAAILAPGRPFKRDLASYRWDLRPIREIYPMSWEALARRVADVRSAVITIEDEGRITTRTQSPWLNTDWGSKPTPLERELIETAKAEGHASAGNRLDAYCVRGEDGWERVIVVAAAEDLEEAHMRSLGRCS